MIKPNKLYAWYSTCIGTRDTNEDNLLWPGKPIRLLKRAEYAGGKVFEMKEKEGLTFAVSDGMGGAAVGEYASLNVIVGLSKSLTTRLNRAQRINDRILRLQSRHGECGATLVCCEFRSDGVSTIAYIESVGDSPAFVIRNGRVRKLTRDDTLYQDLLEAGNLPESDEDLARAKSGLTRYFGQNAIVSTQKYKLLCEPGDVFVLCSDGVPLEDGDEPYFLRDDGNPAKSLVQDSISENKYVTGGDSDNATAIVIKVEG